MSLRFTSIQLVHRDIIFANLKEAKLYKLPDDDVDPRDGRRWRQVRWDTEDKALAHRLLRMKQKEVGIEVSVSVFEDHDLVKQVRLPFSTKNLNHVWSCGSNIPETWHFDVSGFLDPEVVVQLEGE